MTENQLYDELSYVNHSRTHRLHYAKMLIDRPYLIPITIDIFNRVNDKQSPRAGWLLEFVTRDNLNELLPHLDQLFSQAGKIHQDSAVRPIAKICERLAEAFCSKEDNLTKKKLSPNHRKTIIECCFDWLINDEKVAPKAYAMNTLYLLGKEFDWVHPALIDILKRDFPSQSAGFKARAKKILKLLTNTQQ